MKPARLSVLAALAPVFTPARVAIKGQSIVHGITYRTSMTSRAAILFLTLLSLAPTASSAQDASTSPAKRQLDFALGLYQRGDYKEALAEFEVYLNNPEWKDRRDLALFFSGEASLKAGDSRAALNHYEILARDFPDSRYRTLSLYRSAGIYIEAREGEKAVQVLKPIAEKELSKDLETGVWYSLGAAYSLVGDSTQSISWWRRVYEKAPESPEGLRALIGMGFESARSGNCEQAVERVQTWLKSKEAAASPTYPEALKRLAECEERLGAKESALKRWVTLLEIEAASSYWEEAIAGGLRIAFDLSDWKTFEQLAKRAGSQLKSPRSRFEWQVLEGARAYREKKWQEAFDRYGQALKEAESLPQEQLEVNKRSLDPIQIRSAWCAFALENWTAVEEVLASPTEAPHPNDEVLYLRGEASRNQGKWKDAQTLLAQVSEESNFKAEARTGEADAAYQGGDWKEAARLYEVLAPTAKDSEEAAVYYLRASEARRRLEEWAAAGILAAAAVSQTKIPAVRENALYLEGWSRIRAEEYQEAIRAFRDWTSEFQDSERTPEALALLGQAYRRIGDPTSECEVLERLVTQFPKNPWSADGLLNLAAAYSARSDRAGVLNSLVRYQSRYPDKPLHTDYAIWLAEELVESESGEAALGTVQNLLSRELKPAETEKCKFLMAAALELTQEWGKALEAYQTFLAEYPESRRRLEGLLGAAACAKEVGNGDVATMRVEEGLELLAKGGGYEPEIETRLFVLAGDLAFEKEDFQTAYRYYARPGILYRHPKWTPLALEKSALCKDRLGEADKARELREEIAKEYPDYRMETR
jgi:TolA-binding protein